nr:MAG TPA: PGDYG protein [Caudoviricetes sp.]
MAKYVKKPVVFEAVTYEEFIKNVHSKPIELEYNGYIIKRYDDDRYIIPTLEGDMLLGKDDMLITGVDGEIYPCKKEIFEKTYEKA